MNEYTRHLSLSPNPYVATTLCTSNGIFIIDRVNESTIIRKGSQTVLDVQHVTRMRIKHDSIILCTRGQLLFFHGESEETYAIEVRNQYTDIHDMDVFFDPFRRKLVPWFLFYSLTNRKMILQREDTYVDSWDVRPEGFGSVDVLRVDMAVVTTKRTRVYHEGQKNILTKDLHILETSYLYNLNRYMIKTNDFFMLIDDAQLEYLFEHGIQATVKQVDDSYLFHTLGVCKDVHFSRHHDTVLYCCNRSRLCIADTKYPFSIIPNIVVPIDRDSQIYSIDIDHPMYKIYVNTSDQDYTFSMF